MVFLWCQQFLPKCSMCLEVWKTTFWLFSAYFRGHACCPVVLGLLAQASLICVQQSLVPFVTVDASFCIFAQLVDLLSSGLLDCSRGHLIDRMQLVVRDQPLLLVFAQQEVLDFIHFPEACVFQAVLSSFWLSVGTLPTRKLVTNSFVFHPKSWLLSWVFEKFQELLGVSVRGSFFIWCLL